MKRTRPPLTAKQRERLYAERRSTGWCRNLGDAKDARKQAALG
ncbi:MAG TPA: hypothetical protein PKC46_05730 [Sphingorhabdus sp.]|nr:hypothetical protein [Sphingorhabdus sp.]